MLPLALAYALLGFITLTVILSLVDWMAEPEQGITPECVVLVVALWPLIWLKVGYNVTAAAFEDFRAVAQKWIAKLTQQPRLLSQRFAANRQVDLARR